MANKIKVLAVDDHPLRREGIAAVIQGEEDIVLVAEATTGQEAIEAFRIHRPDVTLMDLQMPVMNGIDAILAIRREFPSSKFIALTTYQGDVQALRALKAGATGYLLKNMLRKELLDTIRIVHAEEGRRSPLLALNPTFEFRQRNASRSADEEEIGIRKANEARAHQSVLQTKCASGFGFEFTIRRHR